MQFLQNFDIVKDEAIILSFISGMILLEVMEKSHFLTNPHYSQYDFDSKWKTKFLRFFLLLFCLCHSTVTPF